METTDSTLKNPNYCQAQLMHAMKQNNNEFIVCKFFGSTNNSKHFHLSNKTANKILKLLEKEPC